MFALADCNNFYVSCERVFNPALRGKAVVVLSNNDGCIISSSTEAKQLGITMAQPAHQIEALLKKNNVTIFSANFPLYGDMSRRIMEILTQYTPNIEVYSIDEAFLDLNNLAVADLDSYVAEIRRAATKGTGIPVSIGVAPTKTLAKVANHIAKKQFRKKGYFILDSKEKIHEALKNSPIDDVWGIGRRFAYKLSKYQIHTAWDFTRMPDAWVKRNMSVIGLRTKKELSGIPCIDMESAPPAKKSICVSRSFGKYQSELNQLEEAVSSFAGLAAEKLRRQDSCANIIMVFIYTNKYKYEETQNSNYIVHHLPVPTSSSIEIITYAKAALKQIFKPGFKYKKAGVVLSGLVPAGAVQRALFDEVDRDKHDALMNSMDKLNKKYGINTVRVASQGTARKWRLKQEKLSPQYTTEWKSIIKVKV